MKMIERAPWAAAALAVGFFAFGCENTRRGAREDAREAGQATEDAADRTGSAAEDAADRAGGAASEAGGGLHAAKQTMDVKAALTADTTVDASDIDVDTIADSKTVVLRGTVPSEAQKAAAERIAREKAEGYMIRNELKVAPKR
jgi:osmotically-inducible protein OsmY